ncbi:MAG: rRNA maturation RNase YbeY [Steroidobacteraceae bacterium]|nr:rRNA maturation RNase YbeY [Steroidobacteraceae bacterium]
MTGAHVDMQKRVRTWSPPRADIITWTNAALGRRARNREVGVRVVGRAESRRLNARYRGKDYPTNVLSFPAPPLPAPPGAVSQAVPLGDLVICPHVLRVEARQQKKSLRAHWAHLVVHGALHLIGYDHERIADARRMERREIAVLRRLGFANPYRSADQVSGRAVTCRRR